jgi:hypothetical protein
LVKREGNKLTLLIGSKKSIPEYTASENRRYDLVLLGSEKKQTTEAIIFPENYVVILDVDEFNYSNTDYSISRSLKMDNNRITINDITYLSKRIPKERYPQFREQYIKSLDTRQKITAIKKNNQIFPILSVVIIAVIYIFYKKQNG